MLAAGVALHPGDTIGGRVVPVKLLHRMWHAGLLAETIDQYGHAVRWDLTPLALTRAGVE